MWLKTLRGAAALRAMENTPFLTVRVVKSSRPRSLCPAGVHGVRQGAGERGGRGGLAQHDVPVAASAAGRPRLGEPRGQHRAPAVNSGRQAAGW